jgi:hypothetical protein
MLVRESISFQRGADPKKTLGIGSKKGIEQAIKSLIGSVDQNVVNEYINDLANRIGGIFHNYLFNSAKEELYHLVHILGTESIQVIVEELEEWYLYRDEGDYDLTATRIWENEVESLLVDGWDVWHEEITFYKDNTDVVEFILLKYPE